MRMSPSQSAIRGSIGTSGDEAAPPPPLIDPEPSAPAPDPARRPLSLAAPEEAARPTSCLRGFGRTAAAERDDDDDDDCKAAVPEPAAAVEPAEGFAAPGEPCILDARSGVGATSDARSASGPPVFALSSPSARRPGALVAPARRGAARSRSFVAERSGTGRTGQFRRRPPRGRRAPLRARCRRRRARASAKRPEGTPSRRGATGCPSRRRRGRSSRPPPPGRDRPTLRRRPPAAPRRRAVETRAGAARRPPPQKTGAERPSSASRVERPSGDREGRHVLEGRKGAGEWVGGRTRACYTDAPTRPLGVGGARRSLSATATSEDTGGREGTTTGRNGVAMAPRDAPWNPAAHHHQLMRMRKVLDLNYTNT